MSGIILRPYQTQAITDLRQKFKAGKKRVVLCLPTGAGKTVTFSKMVSDTVNNGKRAMILTNRIELLSQAHNALNYYLPTIYPITAQNRALRRSPAYVAMVETLFRRCKDPEYIRRLGQIDLIIIDECHIGSFRKIFDLFPDAYYVGATATPIATSRRHPLKDYFEDIVEPVTISELIEMGYLVPARTYGAEQDLSDLELASNGEYSDSSLFKHFNNSILYAGVVDKYMQFAPGTKTLCFCVNVEHSKIMAENFNSVGIAARHLDATTPKHLRKRILADFRANRFKVLCNCGILTTGFDEPGISTIIVNRSTTSLPLWLQMCGRGSRLFAEKSHFNIIDMGSNFVRHGLWQAEINWTDKFFNPKKPSSGGVAPVKECIDSKLHEHFKGRGCGALVPASASVCPYCAAVFKKEEKKVVEAEFSEITPEKIKPHVPTHLKGKGWETMTVPELIEYQESKQYKAGWITYKLIERMDVAGLMELAQIKGYKDSWAVRNVKEMGRGGLEEYARLKGYKSGWVKYQLSTMDNVEEFVY